MDTNNDNYYGSMDGDWEDLNGSSGIQEDMIPQNESSHSQRRRRSAAAWQEVTPSLIYPLMGALRKITENRDSADWNTPVCLSGCEVRYSWVKVVSYGGESNHPGLF